MSKVANTCWKTSSKRSPIKRGRARTEKGRKEARPKWVVFASIVTLIFLVCLAINLRAFSEMSAEIEQHEELNTEIQQLTNENMLLLKEVNGLKNDPRTIEREARKIGMSRPNEKILVPVN